MWLLSNLSMQIIARVPLNRLPMARPRICLKYVFWYRKTVLSGIRKDSNSFMVPKSMHSWTKPLASANMWARTLQTIIRALSCPSLIHVQREDAEEGPRTKSLSNYCLRLFRVPIVSTPIATREESFQNNCLSCPSLAQRKDAEEVQAQGWNVCQTSCLWLFRVPIVANPIASREENYQNSFEGIPLTKCAKRPTHPAYPMVHDHKRIRRRKSALIMQPVFQVRCFFGFCLAPVWLQRRKLLLSFLSLRLPSRPLSYQPWRSSHRPVFWLHWAQWFWLLRPPSPPSRLSSGDGFRERKTYTRDICVSSSDLTNTVQPFEGLWRPFSSFHSELIHHKEVFFSCEGHFSSCIFSHFLSCAGACLFFAYMLGKTELKIRFGVSSGSCEYSGDGDEVLRERGGASIEWPGRAMNLRVYRCHDTELHEYTGMDFEGVADLFLFYIFGIRL